MGDIRPTPGNLGEFYGDRMQFEAWLLKTSVSNRATSLLKNALNSRLAATDKKLQYLADKRGITLEKFQRDILLGRAEHMTDEDFAELVRTFEEEI